METDVNNTSDVVDQAPESIQSEIIKSDKEINFEKLRQKTERLERESEEKSRQLEELKQKITAPVVEDLGDDDFVEGRQFKSVREKTAYLEKRQEELISQIRVEKIYDKYKDIDSVVTKENLEKLKEIEPEIHANLPNQDPYITWVNAYKHINTYVKKEKDGQVMAERIANNQQKDPSIQKASQGKKGEGKMFSEPLTRQVKDDLIARRRANIKRSG